ncbi:MAG: Gldg family protein [Chromatiales bacterium]|nr:Gldg family protein [Chromatiales bacterium]
MREIARVAAREFAAFFASPVGYLFLGAFLAAVLFVFFWVEAFFARNIADTRPLFEWLPRLLIFLVAALTMRAWSEERRAGTLELLQSAPVTSTRLVLGKFFAALALVAVALLLTLPLPITVAQLGPLDSGPVAGGYLASLLLAAAYIAVGLWVSARTDNQIVALIGTVLVCGLLWLVGAEIITGLAGQRLGEWLRLAGTGARFDSITRGVIDPADLAYYLSLTGVFLTLTVYALERLRWSRASERKCAHRGRTALTVLVVANFLALNAWVAHAGLPRVDLTSGGIYTLSSATRGVLADLDEPLVLRGYFSAQTHPLLAPLVPQLRDLVSEYAAAEAGRVRVEFIDPADDPDAEREAGERFGVRPVAFQTASKYQAAVVNSYFDLVVQYGDQYERLGYRDLIEIKLRGETDLDVRLRNPEYDLTRAIKKVLHGYRGAGDLWAQLSGGARLRAFVSDTQSLPESLRAVRADLESITKDLAKESQGKLDVEWLDPTGDETLRKELTEVYGFRPIALSLLDPNEFWFYLVAESGKQSVPVVLPETLEREPLRKALESALKRMAPGLLRTVALSTPAAADLDALGLPDMSSGPRFTLLEDALRENAALVPVDLAAGQVPEVADLLLVVDPARLGETAVYAIDQFLMRGGTVVIAATPFAVDLERSISANARPTGLEDWLKHQGLALETGLVVDPQNAPFPIPVERNLGGFVVHEIRELPYPFFPDVREAGLNSASPITADLGQLTLNWVVPIEVIATANAERTVTTLVHASANSGVVNTPDVQPDFQKYPDTGFPRGEPRASPLLAVMVEGRFDSAWADKRSPLADAPANPESGDAAGEETKKPAARFDGVIGQSSSAARLVLIGSGSMLGDTALDLAAQATGTRYLKPVNLIENIIDWSLEDRSLLALRGRAQFSRLLDPVGRDAQMAWEYGNYLVALLGLALVWLGVRGARGRRRRFHAAVLEIAR